MSRAFNTLWVGDCVYVLDAGSCGVASFVVQMRKNIARFGKETATRHSRNDFSLKAAIGNPFLREKRDLLPDPLTDAPELSQNTTRGTTIKE
eukprot:1445062-Amphidinium_carterae.1